MLIGQASINLTANVLSALLGLASVASELLWLTQKGFRFDLAVPKSGRVAAALGSMA